jgi:D-glycero-beta-D-manno-heptose 1-phosphate adenylyltransferase
MKKTEIIHSKIIPLELLVRQVNVWKFHDNKIVFTNGCFDIMHPGHIEYLAKAADLGKRLIIGLNSDDSVRRLNKGDNRPVLDQNARAMILASLFFVDAVVVFDEDTPLNLIKALEPDVLVKGGDYTIDTVVGNDIVKARGGETVIIDFVEGYSTSIIISKILNG